MKIGHIEIAVKSRNRLQRCLRVVDGREKGPDGRQTEPCDVIHPWTAWFSSGRINCVAFEVERL